MGRPVLGDRRLTAAERQARLRDKKAGHVAMLLAAMVRIQNASTVREARKIAAEALAQAET